MSMGSYKISRDYAERKRSLDDLPTIYAVGLSERNTLHRWYRNEVE